MKILFVGFALVIGVLDCAKSDADPVRTIDLHKGENYDKEFKGQDVKISLLEISDSRCPENVQCVWAGEARVGVQVEIGSTVNDSLGLCLDCTVTPGLADAKTYTVDGQSFRIVLTEVNPYPKDTTAETIEQKAVFELQ
ncbi:hypothetical protein LAG90_07310 [Marinilongibacter aquaticus]|uniref:hypothetical protein n=1 Tax=Marinilongibacter aquaticus TaxID=2975157 RepID=UPI0021BD473E|nr:hypothetical protein [Marinilongibacter aquaticus]UBM60450.1 hypothetical protein LAG90_07310 [Marinilongibacter aquaticus]